MHDEGPVISVPEGTCPIRGCGGQLRFDVDAIGRTVPICRKCERRVQRVRALEKLLLGLQRREIALEQLGSNLGSGDAN